MLPRFSSNHIVLPFQHFKGHAPEVEKEKHLAISQKRRLIEL